jgi:hypothetical protein
MVGKWWENGHHKSLKLRKWFQGPVDLNLGGSKTALCRKIVMCCCFGEIRIFEKCWKSL